MTGKKLTTKVIEKNFTDHDEIAEAEVMPIDSVLLALKLVQTDKERKNVKCPYLKAEILIPENVAKTIGEYYDKNNKRKLALLVLTIKK